MNNRILGLVEAVLIAIIAVILPSYAAQDPFVRVVDGAPPRPIQGEGDGAPPAAAPATGWPTAAPIPSSASRR